MPAKNKLSKLKMDKPAIADALSQMAVLLALTDENPFKVRAYERASRLIMESDASFERMVAEHRLTEMDGIGENLALHLEELATTGRLRALEDLKGEIPIGVIGMLRVAGLGPKRIRTIWKQLGITSVGELELLCRRGGLANVEGLGEKLQAKILQSIEFLKKSADTRLLPDALESALVVLETIRSWKEVKRADVAGSIRRCKELVHDIDIVLSTEKQKAVMEKFVKMEGVQSIVQRGEKKSAVILESGIQCDVRAVTDEEYPFTLHNFTGSMAHNVKMRALAKEMGMKLNEYGLFKAGKKSSIKCATEKDIFRAFKMDYVEPELREDTGEIEASREGRLPTLVERSDLIGAMHMHTTYSDGEESVEQMAAAAKKYCFKYIVVADHSQSLTIARGMKASQVARQHDEIDKINSTSRGFRVIKGVEVDILQDGSLDYDDRLLESFEFVVASIHTRFSMPRKEMTKRIVRALSHPLVNALAHPTGRLLLAREPYEVDLDEVIVAAATHKKAIEINGHPQRLDLDWRYARRAKSLGVKFMLGCDAHDKEGILNTEFALWTARKGWLERSDVLNCLSANELLGR